MLFKRVDCVDYRRYFLQFGEELQQFAISHGFLTVATPSKAMIILVGVMYYTVFYIGS
jgi:hypothetical protein